MMAGIDCHCERSGGFQSTVPGDQNIIFIYENGRAKTKFVDAIGDLSDLLLRMGTGVLAFGRICSIASLRTCETWAMLLFAGARA